MAESLYQESVGATGLPGAQIATRYVGAVSGTYPSTGTFLLGDHVIDITGSIWICTTAGTPGTWAQAGGGSPTPTEVETLTLMGGLL